MIDGLVRFGNVVYHEGIRREKAERYDANGTVGIVSAVHAITVWIDIPDGAPSEESYPEHGLVSEPCFVQDKHDRKDSAEYFTSDNTSVGPLLGDSTPLHEED